MNADYEAWRWAAEARLPLVRPETANKIAIDNIQKCKGVERTDPIIDTTLQGGP